MFDVQVLKEWNDIETVLVDDFQETGNEQVLFVPHNFTISESKDITIINNSRLLKQTDCFCGPVSTPFFSLFQQGSFPIFV